MRSKDNLVTVIRVHDRVVAIVQLVQQRHDLFRGTLRAQGSEADNVAEQH